MGLSSSQARLLSLTARMHDIEYKAQRLQADKLRLANESEKAYNTYLKALDATKIQYKSVATDGSIVWNDASLAALENGGILSYTGPTSNDTFLLYDGTHNKVLITPEFAAQYGITGSSAPELGTLEEWLLAHGCTKQPVPDTYTITNGLTNIESIETGSSYSYETGSAPAVSHTDPSSTPITSFTTILKTTDPSKTYTVSTAEELDKLAYLINNGAETDGVTIVLANSFDASSSWTSISNFKGTFNGNGHTISGLSDALFDKLEGATVKNLSLSNSTVNKSTTTNVGILANEATNNSTISKIIISNGSVKGKENVAALIGKADNVTISNCIVENCSIDAKDRYAAGLVGYIKNSTVSNSLIDIAEISSTARVGGMLGYVETCSVTDCTSNAELNINSTSGSHPDSGGFAAVAHQNSNITNCVAMGTLTNNKSAPYFVSGFIGYITSGTRVENSTSSVDIISPNCAVSAFTGNCSADSNPTVKNCSYTGTVTSSQNIYGFAYTVSASLTIEGNNYTSLSGSATQGSVVNNGTITTGTPPSIPTGYAGWSYDSAVSPSATAVSDIALTTPVKGTLSVNASDDKLCKYIAFNIDDGSNYSSNYSTLSGSYNTYQLAELVELLNSGSYSTLSSLTSALTNKYNAADYTLTQTDSASYGISTGSNPDIKTADVSSSTDTINRLAYDIWSKNGGNIDDIKTQVRNAFNNTQLASLTYYYGKSEWTTIVDNLSGNINASSVSAYTNRYDSSWTINSAASNKVAITTTHHPDEWVKDDNYYEQCERYAQLKAMQGYGFEIIEDPNLCSSNLFVNNWLTQSGASLLTFTLNKDGSFIFKDASVATETSLIETDDDKDLRKAEAQYEADMRKIDRKDRNYDTQLAALDNERNAIKSEMETLKNVAKDNVERTFKLFS